METITIVYIAIAFIIGVVLTFFLKKGGGYRYKRRRFFYRKI